MQLLKLSAWVNGRFIETQVVAKETILPSRNIQTSYFTDKLRQVFCVKINGNLYDFCNLGDIPTPVLPGWKEDEIRIQRFIALPLMETLTGENNA